MISLVLSLLPLALAAPTPSPDTGTKVALPPRSLFTHPDGTVDGSRFLNHFYNTISKYKSDIVIPEHISRKRAALKSRADEALTDDVDTGEDITYFGPGSVGATTPQDFTFIFDTGSADTFVPGPTCNTDAGCDGTTKYTQTGTNAENMTSITYGSGMVEGNNYIDDVTIAGLTATKQGFVSLTNAQGFSGSGSDSLMGMGFSTIAQSDFPTFFENLIAQNKVSTPEFGFYLGRSQSNTASDSQLTLGGRDSSKFTGDFTQVPVTTPGYWQVALDGVTVGGTEGLTTAGQAAIDTGTTLIIAPTVAAIGIFTLIPGALAIPEGSETLFAYPCSTTTIPAITFAGNSFSINPLDFNFGPVDLSLAEELGSRQLVRAIREGELDDYCLAGIAAADLDPTENLYVVGDAFLKSWYSVYNYVDANGGPSVSFAKAVGN